MYHVFGEKWQFLGKVATKGANCQVVLKVAKYCNFGDEMTKNSLEVLIFFAYML